MTMRIKNESKEIKTTVEFELPPKVVMRLVMGTIADINKVGGLAYDANITLQLNSEHNYTGIYFSEPQVEKTTKYLESIREIKSKMNKNPLVKVYENIQKK